MKEKNKLISNTIFTGLSSVMHFKNKWFPILLSVLLCHASFGQIAAVKNLEKYDKQRMHFGFLLGINKTGFKVARSNDFYQSDSILSLKAKGQSGFNLGIISDLKIVNNLHLRFIPELAFSQRNIEYEVLYPHKNLPTVSKKIESTFINIPLDLKFQSARVGNYRMYVLAGARYAIDLVSQANVVTDKTEAIVKLKREDYGYEIGFGLDCYLELFKFSPEIKMFQGIPNILAYDAAAYSTTIKSLKSRIFTLSFTFE